MSLIRLIGSRLKDQVTAVKSFKGVTDLSKAQSAQYRDTAFILLIDEQAGNNQLTNYVRQEVITGIAIVLAITNRRDVLGEGGLDELDKARIEVQRALLGWQPDNNSSELIYRRGRLLELVDATIWWQDEYEVKRFIDAGIKEKADE